MLPQLALLARIALTNLFASRVKSAIVGGIIFFGAAIVVVGGALVDSIAEGMSRSLIGSVAGHIQVYSSLSKDELALWGDMGGGDPDLTPLDDFALVRRTLETVPGVTRVVPMGAAGALVSSGNTIDIALEGLRRAVQKQVDGDRSRARADEIALRKAHVRRIVEVLQEDLKTYTVLVEEEALDPEDRRSIAEAATEGFWRSFDRDPLAALEFLENRIAPQVTDADLLFVRYVGTDPEAFARNFDRMRIVDGGPIPPGRRGFLVGKFFYEDQLKLKTARRLDKIHEALSNGRRIQGDAELERYVRENTTQVREILLQLDPTQAALATARLQAALRAKESDLGRLLTAFLSTNDADFRSRYEIFYRDLAPLLELYRIRVGDSLTIKAFTRSGYVQSVRLRVYGTFEFKGLEKAPLAGFLNLMDLVSFRELFGYLTAEKAQEIRAIQESVGAASVPREGAEEALFSGGKSVVADATSGVFDEFSSLGGAGAALARKELSERVYPTDELQKGVVLSAAVMLRDPRRIETTIRAIEDAGKRDGLPLKAVSWRKASGLIGQFVILMRIVLYTAVLIIFVVALVIINNSMVMATLERVQEIGTLRAIGAQRRFLTAMLLVEALALGTLFGGLGTLLGVAIVKWIAAVGIPATSDVMFFFFSGPRLHPGVTPLNVGFAVTIVLAVATLSSFYPAWIAMRVAPVRAMQEEE